MDRAALDAMASELGRGNLKQEQVFAELRARGVSPIGAIYIVSRVFDISLPEAKSAIFASGAWRDQQAGWQVLHNGFEDTRDAPD